MTVSDKLPAPDTIAQQHSEQLLALIQQKIVDAGGKISFAEYMQLCLYAPGLGYYSAGSYKLGQKGDFTTAPEISPLFSRTLAHHVNDVFQQLKKKDILEFGAGSGKMAADILTELSVLQALPDYYYIIETSADLRQRQQQTISSRIPHLAEKVVWLDKMPHQFVGVVLANEVCDAMPVHCLRFKDGKVSERHIESDDSKLQWCDGSLSHSHLAHRAAEIKSLIDSDSNYITEINLSAEAWLASLAENIQQGAIFIIDYGYPQSSYYHPQRTSGTLMCYFQHQGHDNPLILQGLQDITAHVDFTALAQSAVDNGLQVAGFQSQADFLLAGGITELNHSFSHDGLALMQQASQIKRLTLPSEMGENFKVLSLTKDIDHLLPRLQLGDRRYSL
ncbi:MAG: SAM-dependent methyltransferase [Gammaproteobacteria bacterium]|nr:SAM-dependent methyltransferase [Gammaproteobacteria bacterium]